MEKDKTLDEVKSELARTKLYERSLRRQKIDKIYTLTQDEVDIILRDKFMAMLKNEDELDMLIDEFYEWTPKVQNIYEAYIRNLKNSGRLRCLFETDTLVTQEINRLNKIIDKLIK